MRVLVVKLSALGDIVHAFPAVEEALEQVRGLELDWLVDPRYRNLVSAFGPVASVLTPADIPSIAAGTYDLVVDLQGLIRSAWHARRLGAPVAGPGRSLVREWPAHWFYARPVSVPPGRHAADELRLILGRALDYEPAAVRPLRPRRDPAENRQVWLFHGTSQRAKLWPVAHWISLATALSARGYVLHLAAGTPEERKRARQIADAVPGTIPVDAPDYAEWVRLLAGARLAISVDTGLGHLADWLGCPTIMLFQASDPRRTGTQGAWSRTIWAGEQPRRPSRRERNSPPVGQLVSPEQVLSVLESLPDVAR